MNALTGMEKFSHLEDKVYLTVEFVKKMREERETWARETSILRRDAAEAIADKKSSEEKLAVLLAERETMQVKVEAMLEAISQIDPELAVAVGL